MWTQLALLFSFEKREFTAHTCLFIKHTVPALRHEIWCEFYTWDRFSNPEQNSICELDLADNTILNTVLYSTMSVYIFNMGCSQWNWYPGYTVTLLKHHYAEPLGRKWAVGPPIDNPIPSSSRSLGIHCVCTHCRCVYLMSTVHTADSTWQLGYNLPRALEN